MPVGTTGFIGERLTEARESRGHMSSSSLADILSVSATTVIQWEKNIVTPRPEMLEKIAIALNFRQSFFLKPSSNPKFERCFWRSMSSATKSARTRAQRRFGWLIEITEYLKKYLDLPQINFPDPIHLGIPENPLELTDDQIEGIALKCRNFWGLSDIPIADFVLLLENNGVVVSRGKLEAEKLDAFSNWCNTDRTPYIFLTADKESAVRSRTDAAHELGHLILHQNVTDQQLNNPKTYKLIENQAFRFGGAFLMPAQSFLSDLWSPNLDAFYSLKERWQVSIAAMIKRCSDLEHTNEDQISRLWANYNRRGWKRKEPLDNVLIPEQPRLLKRCFDLLLDSGIKTREQILLDLSYSPHDIATLAGLPEGYFEESFGQVKLFPSLQPKTTFQSEKGTVLPFSRD